MRRNTARGSDDRGFTMVEALVALLVFGLGILMLMQLAPRSTHSGIQGHKVSEAMNLAQAKVEELRALPKLSDELTAGTHVDATGQDAYERRWIVTEDNPIAGMKRVSVRVKFASASADSVAEITTYF